MSNLKNLFKSEPIKWFLKHSLTIASCVLITGLGIAFLVWSSPGTTTIGENISTGNITVSGDVTVSGDLEAKTGRTATFIIAASDSSTTAKAQADYVCDGTADNVEIQAALTSLASSGGKVLLLEGTYNLAAGITLSAKTELLGSGWGAVLDTSSLEDAGVDVITMGDYTVLSHLKVRGAVGAISSTWAPVRVGNHSLIEWIWLDELSFGIETEDKKNVHIRDSRFTEIRSAGGSAASIHAKGTSRDIYISRVYIENSDRAFEVEDGASNFFASMGTLINVYPLSAIGYTFTLDAHSHPGGGGVDNVVYKDFYLEDSGAPDAYGDNAVADYVRNITLENITIVDPWTTQKTFSVARGSDIVVRNVRYLNASTTAFSAMNIDGLIVEDNRFSAGSTFDADTYLMSVTSSTNPIISKNTFLDVKGMGAIALYNSNTNAELLDNYIKLDATNPSHYGISDIDSTMVTITGNTITGGQPATAAMNLRGPGGIVAFNYVVKDDIWLTSTSQNFWVFENNIVSGFVLNQGTNNKVYRNKGYVTENSGAATIAAGTTSIVVTHGLATTPTRVYLTPTNSMGNATKFYAGNLTTTQFTIYVDVDPGATTATFNWRAVIGEGN
jgi:hypothetical protein